MMRINYAHFLFQQALGDICSFKEYYNDNPKFITLLHTFGILGLMIQLCLIFWEPVSMINHYNDNENETKLLIVIELICFIMHEIQIIIMTYFFTKYAILRKHSKEHITFIVISIVFSLGILLNLIDIRIIRIHRILRPCFIYLYWNHARWSVGIVLSSFAVILKPMLLLFTSLILFSLIVFSLFNPQALKYSQSNQLTLLQVCFLCVFVLNL